MSAGALSQQYELSAFALLLQAVPASDSRKKGFQPWASLNSIPYFGAFCWDVRTFAN